MFGTFFYDVPVYRISQDKYDEDLDEHIKNHQLFGKDMEDFYTRYPGRKDLNEDMLIKNYGGAWVYNEIIGFIQLYFSGNQILGVYFESNAKRHVKTRRKQYIYRIYKLAPEVSLPLNANNQIIFKFILKYLNACKKELSKERFIDAEKLKIIGPYVDWKKLISEESVQITGEVQTTVSTGAKKLIFFKNY